MTDPESVGGAVSGPIISGLQWAGLSTVVGRIVAIARGVILARLIGPTSFGTFLAVSSFVAFVSLASELGVTSYLVHRGAEARAEAGAAQRVSLAGGLVGTLIIIALAFPMQKFYGEPGLWKVDLALAPMVLLATAYAAPIAVLRVELRFRGIAAAELAGAAVGLSVGVVLAVARLRVWALVGAALSSQLVSLALAMYMSGVRPTANHGASLAKQIRSFGIYMAATGLLWGVVFQGDNAIVGRKLGATALGQYGLAFTYGMVPGTTLGSMTGQVAFPTFATSKHDRDALADHLLRFSTMTALVAVPLVAISIALARLAVLSFLGPSWLPAVAPLRILLAVGLMRGLYPTDEILLTFGKVRFEFMIAAVAAPATLVAAATGSVRSISFVALFVGLVYLASAIVGVHVAERIMEMRRGRLLTVPLRFLPPALIGAVASRVVAGVLPGPLLSRTLLGAAAGVLTYLGGLRLRGGQPWELLTAMIARRRLRQ